jgi:hypothetical protein
MVASPRRLPDIEAYRLAGTELLREPDHYSPPLSSVAITVPFDVLNSSATQGQLKNGSGSIAHPSFASVGASE